MNKAQTAQIKKQISETRNKINKLRESKKNSFPALMESELEKSGVVFAAKEIVEKLQNAAEDLAPIETKDLMDIETALKTEFGDQFAASFNEAATSALRSAVDAIKAAKDAITSQVARMEAVVNGEPANDMALDTPPADPLAGDLGGDSLGGDTGMGDPLAGEDSLGGDDVVGDAPPEDELGADMADPEAPENSLAAGRPRKDESAEFRNSKNPDAFILEAFKKALKEGVSPRSAAKGIANIYGIDVTDVREIVKEGLRPFSQR